MRIAFGKHRFTLVWLFAALGIVAVALPACNTMEGVGEDIGAAGEAIEDAADGDD